MGAGAETCRSLVTRSLSDCGRDIETVLVDRRAKKKRAAQRSSRAVVLLVLDAAALLARLGLASACAASVDGRRRGPVPTSRSSASSRLRFWLRWLCATSTSTPSKRQPSSGQPLQPLTHIGRQRRRVAHVEAQLHRGRGLVDVLAARSGGAHEGFVDLRRIERQEPAIQIGAALLPTLAAADITPSRRPCAAWPRSSCGRTGARR